MDWKLNFLADNILEIKAHGTFSNDSLIKMCEQIIRNPEWKRGMNAIADFREVNTNGMSPGDLFISRDIHVQFDNMAGDGKVAVILDMNPGAILGRAYIKLADIYVKSELKSFTDYEKGMKWLKNGH
jgi:hypothetical protein